MSAHIPLDILAKHLPGSVNGLKLNLGLDLITTPNDDSWPIAALRAMLVPDHYPQDVFEQALKQAMLESTNISYWLRIKYVCDVRVEYLHNQLRGKRTRILLPTNTLIKDVYFYTTDKSPFEIWVELIFGCQPETKSIDWAWAQFDALDQDGWAKPKVTVLSSSNPPKIARTATKMVNNLTITHLLNELSAWSLETIQTLLSLPNATSDLVLAHNQIVWLRQRYYTS